MRINIRRITRHAGIVEIMLIGSDARACAKIDLCVTGRVVPRIARLGHLIVPSGRSNGRGASNQRTECPAGLIQSVNYFTNFKRIAYAERHGWRGRITTVFRVSDRIRCVAQNFAETNAA